MSTLKCHFNEVKRAEVESLRFRMGIAHRSMVQKEHHT